ncbi:MAG: hypothetical protein K0R34_598 [Herbinix sp.]|jgi:hypothetical protein|nr:hypothetical protein [Herbinix sp.]
MTLQYEIAGGQLLFDKVVFAKELLLVDSSIKKLIYPTSPNSHKPKVIKEETTVVIDFNHGAEITVDEGFYDLFKRLKNKYQGRVKGKVVIRISAITSYYVTLDLSSEDERVVYES